MGNGRLRGWLALSWPDRAQLLILMLGLPLVSLALRVFGYVKTRRWLERNSSVEPRRTATPGELEAAENLAQLAAIAGRHGPVNTTCLRQSLLVYWRLRRLGLSPELKLGVRKVEAVMDAHAWVELEGSALAPAEITHLPFPPHQVS